MSTGDSRDRRLRALRNVTTKRGATDPADAGLVLAHMRQPKPP
jgi:hypothetical protein